MFNADVCCVSRKFVSLPIPKMITDGVILSLVLKRTVRFLTIVDITLDEHNNYQPNNKWLGVKYVSIVFGQNYFNGVLLMIG